MDLILVDRWPHPLTAEGREQTLLPSAPGATALDVVRAVAPDALRGALDVRVDGLPVAPRAPLPPRAIVTVRAAVEGDSLRTILQIAVLAASIAVGNVAALGAWASVAGAGVAIVGNLVVNALIPPEVPGGSAPQRDPVYALTGGANRARPYEPLLLLLGRHRVYGDLAASEYTERNGDDQYLYQLFDWGVATFVDRARGKDRLADVRIGGTAIGEYEGVSREWVEPGEDATLVDARVTTLAGAEIPADEVFTRNLPAGTRRIEVELAAVLAQRKRKNGRVFGAIATVTVRTGGSIRRVRVGSGPDADHPGDPARVTVGIDLGGVREGWSVEVSRTAFARASGHDIEQDVVTVAAVRCHRAAPDGWTAPPSTRLALRIRASRQLHGRVDRLSAVAETSPWRWVDGAWREPDGAPGRNPAAVYVSYCRGWWHAGARVAGVGLAAESLDAELLGDWHEFCAREGLSCDLLIDAPTSHAEMLRLIARTGRASPTWQTGRLGVVRENPARVPTALLTPGNIVAGSYRMEWASRATATEIAARFVDPEADWQFSMVRAAVPGARGAAETAEVTLRGVTDREQARREAARIAARQAYHRRRHSWAMGREGGAIARGDVVLASPALIGGDAGRVAGGDAERVELDRDVHVPFGATLLVRTLAGDHHATAVKPGASAREVVLADPLAAAPGADGADPRDVLWRLQTPEDAPMRLLVVDTRPTRDGGVEFAAIDDDPRYYAAAGGDAVLEAGDGDGESRVLSAQVFDRLAGPAVILTVDVAATGDWRGATVETRRLGASAWREAAVIDAAATSAEWQSEHPPGATVEIVVVPVAPGPALTVRHTIGLAPALPPPTDLRVGTAGAARVFSFAPSPGDVAAHKLLWIAGAAAPLRAMAALAMAPPRPGAAFGERITLHLAEPVQAGAYAFAVVAVGHDGGESAPAIASAVLPSLLRAPVSTAGTEEERHYTVEAPVEDDVRVEW